MCLYTGGRCLHYRQFTRSVKSANLTPDYCGRISLLIQSVNHTQTWLHVPCINRCISIFTFIYMFTHCKKTHTMLWHVTCAYWYNGIFTLTYMSTHIEYRNIEAPWWKKYILFSQTNFILNTTHSCIQLQESFNQNTMGQQ